MLLAERVGVLISFSSFRLTFSITINQNSASRQPNQLTHTDFHILRYLRPTSLNRDDCHAICLPRTEMNQVFQHVTIALFKMIPSTHCDRVFEPCSGYRNLSAFLSLAPCRAIAFRLLKFGKPRKHSKISRRGVLGPWFAVKGMKHH